MKVNGQEAEPGCYIAGHNGQYGIDGLADVCEQFDIEVPEDDDPRYWRRMTDYADDPDFRVAKPGVPGHFMSQEDMWDRHMWAGDDLETKLNNATEGGYWSWEDGEFFLLQTEIEAFVYYLGENYDDAWSTMLEYGPDQGYLDMQQALDIADDQPEDLRVYRFAVTIRYEPDDSPEPWTDNEIARGLDN